MVHGGLKPLYDSNVMVLKEVNLKILSTMYVSDSLESSQFCLYTQWSQNESILMLNSLCQSQMILKEVTFGC